MSVDTTKRPLTQLNQEIEVAQSEVAKLEAERKAVAGDASRSAGQLRWLHLASAIRKPTASFEMWPIVVLIVGSGSIGILTLIVVHLLSGWLALGFLALLVGAAGGAYVFYSLLYRPADAVLPAAISEAESRVRLAQARLKEKVERITETTNRLQSLVDERRHQIASGKLQKAALLQRNWKGMRDTEWEDFVVEVCRTLEAKVERIGGSRGEDANLIADFGPRRVAIFTQSADQNVSSATIQLALAARERHGCESCAVIINRRFTGAAQDFAQRNGCAAIGAVEFPDFVLGKIEL